MNTNTELTQMVEACIREMEQETSAKNHLKIVMKWLKKANEAGITTDEFAQAYNQRPEVEPQTETPKRTAVQLPEQTILRIYRDAKNYQKVHGGNRSDYHKGAMEEARNAAETIKQLQDQLTEANKRAREIAAYLRSDKFATQGNDYVHVSTDMIHKIEELTILTNQ